MFIAMNRFKVIKEERKAFEDLWVTRQSHLDEVKGFRAFHLLRGPEREDHVLYSSHTIWASQEDFTAWTKSEQFRAAHQHAGERKPLTLGHPDSKGSKSSRRSKPPSARIVTGFVSKHAVLRLVGLVVWQSGQPAVHRGGLRRSIGEGTERWYEGR
jgi:heme-degrading monooxygenase HmoA